MRHITPCICFIGCEDDNLDLFEAQYPLVSGISYNSYLIFDKKIAIIDAVDARRTSDWLATIDSALSASERRTPDYIIVQHMEPDHSGSLHIFIERYPEAKIVTTSKAADMMRLYFEHIDWNDRIITVADGDTLSLGENTLHFVTAPMVHWPEVTMTICHPQGLLFSADAFGSFAMSTSTEAWDSEARRYYTNIVGRFGPSVQAIMKKLSKHPFSIVAPLHGPILTGDLSHHLHLYDKWSSYSPETPGVLVAYASVYGGTAEVARRIAGELSARKAGEVVLLDLCRHDVSYAVAEAFRLSAMVLCSVTFDGTMFPAMESFLSHIRSKNLRNRTVALVQNGTWAPMAARHMSDALSHMKDMTVIEPVLTIRGRMHDDDNATIATLCDNLTDAITSPIAK